MQFKQLEALVNVISFGSFSKAADALYLSQPTISSHISALEKELGTKLLIRSTKETFPSEAGKVLFKYAKDILRLRDQAVQAIRQEQNEISGVMQIASSTFAAQFFLPDIMQKLIADNKNLSFMVMPFETSEVAQAVLDSLAEIGVTEMRSEKRNLEFEPIAECRMVYVYPVDMEHEGGRGKELSQFVDMLVDTPFIVCEDDSFFCHKMRRFLNTINVGRRDLNIVATVPDHECSLRAVESGLGAAIVPEEAANSFVTNNPRLRIIDPDHAELKYQLYLCYRTNKTLSPSAELFRRTLIDNLRKRRLGGRSKMFDGVY